MTTTKALADLPTLSARLRDVLSEPPEFGPRQTYGPARMGIEIASATVGRASLDVGLQADSPDVVFASLTGQARHSKEREQVCGDAVALVAAVCNSDPETVKHRWPTLLHLSNLVGADHVSTASMVLDDVAIELIGSQGRLDLSCEPA